MFRIFSSKSLKSDSGAITIIFVHDLEKFENDRKTLGERGLYIPAIGSQWKTCFQSLVEHWVGTENLVYALADYPETVEVCLEVMKFVADKNIHNSLDSSAEVFIFFEDSSTTNISPTLFEKYTAPQIQSWSSKVHKAGKMLMHHA